MFWRRRAKTDAEFLVVGLGNPGEEYRQTPHNLGYMTIDRLAEDEGIRVTRPEENALVGLGSIGGKSVVLAKPLSFMNLSGGPIKGLLRRYELSPDRLLVVCDELDLPWETLRLKLKGSAAGHNGMKSVISSLGSPEFARLRIGIHPGHRLASGADFVLRPFHRDELDTVDAIVNRAADVVRRLLAEGAEKAMADCNRRAHGQQTEEL